MPRHKLTTGGPTGRLKAIHLPIQEDGVVVDRSADHSRKSGNPAEQRLRRRALELQVQDQIAHGPAAVDLPSLIHPYLAVSREVGAGGSEVAAQVGEKLGWEVLDRELLDQMANDFHLREDMLEHLDETSSNWVVEVFGKWMDQHLVTQAEFVVHLGQIVLATARRTHAVFVGRGAQFLLPRERGLAVRVTAPRRQRIERIMQRHDLPRDKAEKYIDRHEQGRTDFVKKYFHHDVNDARIYDLVVNIEYLDIHGAVELIADQMQRQFASRGP